MPTLGDLGPSVEQSTSARFTLVSYVPTYGAVLFLLWLVWAGAPGPNVSIQRATNRLNTLSAGDLTLVVLATTLLALLLHPLQLPLVRILEGYWPDLRVLHPLRGHLLRRKSTQMRKEAARTVVSQTSTAHEVQKALEADWDLRRHFPPPGTPLLPTALGNVLRAAEATAGRPFGLEAVTAWPRLYPLIGDRLRGVVDDRRNALDLTCRVTVTGTVTGVATIGLLAQSGVLVLIALVPIGLTCVAYRGAIQAAISYGEAVTVAVELCRFDLLRALHLPLPATPAEERQTNTMLSRFWGQDVPLDQVTYQHGADAT